MRFFSFFVLLTVLGAACTNTLFEDSGNRFSAPIAVAVDTVNARAYVVNSNNNREFADATLSVLDLADPRNPVLLDNATTPIPLPNFSGRIYLDAAARLAYLSNRNSDNADDNVDALLRINLDETSSSFGRTDSFSGGDNPFGIACCDTAGRIYVATNGGTLNVFDPSNLSSSVQVSLAGKLASDEQYSGASSTEVVLSDDGTQGYVSNRGGRVYVINTAEVGDTAKNPIDYLILNVGDARGLAISGSTLVVVDGTKAAPLARILNVSSLTPLVTDASIPTEVEAASIQTAAPAAGDDPNEVVVFGGRAFVTNRGTDSVSVIDLATNTVTATLSVGDEPFGLVAFSLGGTDYLYVTNLAANSLSVIDLASDSVVGTLSP